MKYLWHSSALEYLIEIRCFDDVSSLLEKDTNFVDLITELSYSENPKIAQYYTLDKDEPDYTIYKEHKGGSVGEEPDDIHVFVKVMKKDYNIVISYPPVLKAYRQKIGNRCKTVFDIMKSLYDNKKLTDEILCKIMNNHEMKFKSRNLTSLQTIQAYKYLHNKYSELKQKLK